MSTEESGRPNLDDLLEQELERGLGHLQGPRAQFYQSAYYWAFCAEGDHSSAFSWPRAAALAKVAAGVGAAALVTGGGVVVAIASTGSADPGVWGKTVSTAVASCKDQQTEGQHGIGQCVSAVAKQKGEQERAVHSASPTPENHPGIPAAQNHSTGLPVAVPPGQAKQHPTGPPAGVPAGDTKSHPTGPPQTHPTGRPSGVPAGPPANLPPAAPGIHPTGPPVSPPPHP
jgi:hypothetical protein